MVTIKTKHVISILAVISVLLLIAGCGGGSTSAQFGQLSLSLIDAPIDGADRVDITISKVDVNKDGIWQTLSGTEKTFNLLDLRDVSTVLAEKQLPVGHYSQIRLFVKSATITIAGKQYPITIPSAAQTGIKLINEFDITADTVKALMLDFDVRNSVVVNGKGYQLKPTIRVADQVISGTIKGYVTPATGTFANPIIVEASQNGTVVGSSTIDPTTGSFSINALVQGNYDIRVYEDAATPTFNEYTQSGVTVVVQQDTMLSTQDNPVKLQPVQ